METKKLHIPIKGEDGYRTFTVRLEEGLLQQIEQYAYQSNFSRNEMIGVLLEYALPHVEIVSNKKTEK